MAAAGAAAAAAAAGGGGGGSGKIDEDLYSRQLFVMGHAAQARMAASDVLVVGAGGLGVEIAKNVILMGVKSVTLWDPAAVAVADLTTNFYLGEGDVGAPRAAAVVAKLAGLNQYVVVRVAEEAALCAAMVARASVVVAAGQPLAVMTDLAGWAREAGAKFVAAEALGVFSRIFCDFGPSFRVDDATGEPPQSAMIAGVTNEAAGVVTTFDEMRHGLVDGDYVTFVEVGGMNELNGSAPRPVKVRNPYAFTIEDTTGYAPYVRGGWVHQVKMPVDVAFKPLADMLGPVGSATGPADADLVFTDYAKAEVTPAVHAAFAALHAAAASAGALPAGDDSDAAAGVAAATATALGRALRDDEARVVRQLCRTARGALGPLVAAVGGIAAQEVLKAVSGKFMPVRQWLYFDAVEVLPGDGDTPLPADEVAPRGSRYDGQIAVLGAGTQAALGALRYFLVGAGAIGCEMLKNWAMMGVGAGDGGSVTVTDMDRIERSNLSRQFLFRPADIGAAKSRTAAAAAAAMNPALHVVPYEARVGGEGGGPFDDAFWEGLSGVCTALDNVEARLYVDSRCVYYGLSLLESGTLGTKGNTQVVLPRVTENYGATRDPPEKGIPVCTLKNFPFKIEHTLQWARDWFEGEFKQVPDAVNAYLASDGFLGQLASQPQVRIDTLQSIAACLGADRPASVADCVAWARTKFEELYANAIRQLLHNFPPGMKTADGTPFWSGSKRQPVPLAYNAADPAHAAFIATVATLRATMFGVPLAPTDTPAAMAAAAAAVPIATFSPAAGVKIAANEKELEEMNKAAAAGGEAAGGAGGGGGWDVDDRARAIEARLPPRAALGTWRMVAHEFEKDDDLHISAVTAVSNLRARNYAIGEADKHTSKGIAGKIIPAIATTTALVAGLVCLELYKLVGRKPLASFRNTFANLALPLVAMSEPLPAARSTLPLPPGATFVPPPLPSGEAAPLTVRPDGTTAWEWSVWDRLDLTGPLTTAQLLAYYKEALGVDVQMLTYGGAILYAFYLPPPKKRERMGQHVATVAIKLSAAPLPSTASAITLEVTGKSIATGADVELPSIRYRLGEPELAARAAKAAAVAAAVAAEAGAGAAPAP